MTVIAFPPKAQRHGAAWPATELKEIVETLAPQLTSDESCGWDVGMTERGDPQFYLLGPPPHDECLLCISRLGRLYVLEDGAGRVIFEHNSLVALAEQAGAFLQRKKAETIARAALIWCAVRESFEEKFEPILGEAEELLAHFAPQIAAIG